MLGLANHMQFIAMLWQQTLLQIKVNISHRREREREREDTHMLVLVCIFSIKVTGFVFPAKSSCAPIEGEIRKMCVDIFVFEALFFLFGLGFREIFMLHRLVLVFRIVVMSNQNRSARIRNKK